MVEGIFHVKEKQTTVHRELLAGLTTFMTMAYVAIVNPQILAESGMPVDGVLFAACISFAVATLVYGTLGELSDCPRVAAIPGYATAPALVLVGVLMCGAVARVRWDDFSEAFLPC